MTINITNIQSGNNIHIVLSQWEMCQHYLDTMLK